MNVIHCHAMTVIIISSRIEEEKFLDDSTDIVRLKLAHPNHNGFEEYYCKNTLTGL